MSFNKVVNGVTFTSDNFTNIDVSFDKKGFFTYIYISTTDNQAFNNDTTSDYHIVHDDINIGVTQILLQNNNKTAKLYVHTRDFNEYNSYNIQQLPLTETGKNQETDTTQETGATQETGTTQETGATQETGVTQKLVEYSENGYKVYIPSDCVSINGGRTSPNYTGFEVVPPTGLTLNSDIVKTIYADVNGDNSTRVQGTLNGNNIKFIFSDTEWSVLNYSRVRDTKGNLIYNLQNYVKQLEDETESIKPYALADVWLKCNDENATLKVTENTATLTAVSGHKITSASITSKKHNIFQEKYDFTISKDGSNATITLTPSKDLDYTLKVTTVETKKFNGIIVLENNVKDKIKFDFDNQITVKISVTDNKYNINSLYYLYQPRIGANWEKSSNGFTINADKKTATLVIPDNVLSVPNDTSYVFKLKIGGDIADTTPLEPETTTAKTQRVYMVDDKGLSELTKQAIKYFNGSKNTNYDFTEFINQLYYLPFTVDENLSDPTNKIDTGLWSLNAPAREMKDSILNIDLGTINVIPENNNGFDYNIESIRIYLPLVLPFEIDFQDCYKKIISINYKINLLTGNATINISSNDKIISTFNQNVQTNLQMFNIYNNKDFGSLNNPVINKILTPYIKVNYYKPVENLVSYETLEHNNLSSYTNFVKTRNASVSCGTKEEQTEIENLLNGGIYIK